MNPERSVETLPLNPYETLSDLEVSRGFFEGKVPGQIVMGRALQRVGLDESAKNPLYDRNGDQMTLDNRLLNIEDYLDIAAVKNHGPAIPIIANFVAMPKDHEGYRDAQQAILAMISSHMHQPRQ